MTVMVYLMEGKTVKVSPQGERLKFARNNKTGRVHILPGTPGADLALPGPREVSFAEGLMGLTARRPMLCGTMLILGFDDEWPAMPVAGDHFADDDLCIVCVRALGDQQWRAFHADNRCPS